MLHVGGRPWKVRPWGERSMHTLHFFSKEAVLGIGEQRHLLSSGRVSCGIPHHRCLLRGVASSSRQGHSLGQSGRQIYPRRCSRSADSERSASGSCPTPSRLCVLETVPQT